jgi:hypothetical protein
MLILPHVLNDIIWRFAFAQSFYTGFKEVCMLVEFRSCVPHAFCGKSTLHHETQVFVLNPYCPGTPYLPLDSVYYHPFSPLRDWIARKVPVRYIRSVLRTYPKVMRRYAFSQDMAHWNRALTKLKKLRREHTPLFSFEMPKYYAVVEMLKDAKPLSSACLNFPWPGSRASLLSRS